MIRHIKEPGRGLHPVMVDSRRTCQHIKPAAETKTHFFATAQACAHQESALYAWGRTTTIFQNAFPRSSGMGQRHGHERTIRDGCPLQTDWSSVSTGSSQRPAPAPPTLKSIYAQVAERPTMEPKNVLERRRSEDPFSENTRTPIVRSPTTKHTLQQRAMEALTPYHSGAWAEELQKHGLCHRYPHLSENLVMGFDVGISVINETYAPPNDSSVKHFPSAYSAIVEREFATGRYLGPFSKCEVENLIGPFQSSPLSLVPKPEKPGKYRAVHNFSHPHVPSSSVCSINSSINADDYPCTYGTFGTVCLIISQLPPGSQASVRDVAEAYQTIPIQQNQWPGLVVHLRGDVQFAINTSNNFGLTSGGGVYGSIADAGTDIFRANGMGPVSKWVDDHMFFRIPHSHLQAYNENRAAWRQEIAENGGRIHNGSRIWYSGKTMPDGNLRNLTRIVAQCYETYLGICHFQ